MNKNDLKIWLLSSLENATTAAGGKQIVCRCHMPGCNDTSRHLYIGPFDDNEKPIMYNCMKCPASGIVDQNFLEMYNINDELGRELIKVNKGSSIRIFNNRDKIYKVTNNYVTECDMSRIKLNYINKRLGTNFSYQDCLDNKIVLNLEDLLKSNNIYNITRHENVVKQLNLAFIGFLSRSNGSLNMRNLAEGKVLETINRKYINYNIFDSTPENDYYILPTEIDPNKKVKLYIGEGPFDILGIKYNVINDQSNSIYVAGKGKAYFNIIEFFITHYGLYDLEIHLFPDKDVTDRSIDSIAVFLNPFHFDIYKHRNGFENEKDFGVPRQNIIDVCTKISY